MGIFRIYPTKSNTIASGVFENYNSGQNAAAELWYGGSQIFSNRNSISRHLAQYDIAELQRKLNSKEIMSGSVLSYTLYMKNAIPRDAALQTDFTFNTLTKEVASSFDLVAFPINKTWDEGGGHDLLQQNYVVKQLGNPRITGYSNWIYATRTSAWDEPGVYTSPTASTTSYIYSGSVDYSGITFSKFNSTASGETFNFSITSATGLTGNNITVTVTGNSIDYAFNPLSGSVSTYQYVTGLTANSGFTALTIQSTSGSTGTTISTGDSFILTANTQSQEIRLWAEQHFDIGDENVNMNITNMVKNWLSGGSQNYGIGLAFRGDYEGLSANTRSVSSYLTEKTNTAFKPYIEVRYNQVIRDDRDQVTNNRPSRLFLYTFSGNNAVDYYSAGTVNILAANGSVVHSALTPTQLQKGVYYVDVLMSAATVGQTYRDVWPNVTFVPGIDQQDFTQTFRISKNYYQNATPSINDYIITTYGIDNGSTIRQQENIRVFAEVRSNYSQGSPSPYFDIKYTIVMNNEEEVIPWTSLNRTVRNGCQEIYFDLDASWLLHNQTYEIIFKIEELGSSKLLNERIRFNVLRDL